MNGKISRTLLMLLPFYPQVSAANCEALYEVKEIQNILKMADRDIGPRFLDLALQMAIPSRPSPAAAELKNIYTHLSRNLEFEGEMLPLLNGWAQRHNIDVEFVGAKKLLKLAEEAKDAGLLSLKERSILTHEIEDVTIIGRNGFVDGEVWNFLVANPGGKKSLFPIIDPHDLFHLVSFTQPGFNQALRKKAAVTHQIRREYRQAQISPAGVTDGHAQRIKALDSEIHEVIRAHSYERFTFLEYDANGEPRLVMQGNASFNFMMFIRDLQPIYRGQAETKEYREKQKQYLRRNVDFFAGKPVAALENLETAKFAASSPENSQALDNYRRAVKKLGLTSIEESTAINHHIGLIIERHIMPKAKTMNADQFAEFAVKVLAEEISLEPRLKEVFSMEARHNLLTAGNEFITRYRDWSAAQPQ